MTQAFRMLQDPRCYFVELPRHRPDPPAFKYVFRNNLRKAYLREMVRQHPTNETLRAELENPATNVPKQRKYVALHHFHPTVIRAFYENPLTLAQKHKVPISITEHELGELGTECRDEDRILSISGTPTGGYYFTPSYPHEKACKDLKVLIQAVRNRTHKKSPTRSKRRSSDPNVPTDIEITTTTRERDSANDSKANVDKEKNKKEGEGENENESENDKKERAQGKSVFKNRAVENDVHVRSGVLESGNDDSEEFDKIWDKSSRREIESSVLNETIIEEEEDAIAEENADETKEQPETDARSAQHKRESLLSRRSTDRPWATPKYRRDREKTVRRVSAAADYIDPNNIGELNDKLASTTGIVDDGEDIARIAADMTVLAQDKSALVSPVSTPASPSRDVKESPSVRFSPLRTPYSPIRRPTSDDDTMSLGSTDSALKNYTMLDHQLPGADPTLRIQVHNDLIAWESKRRSDLAQQLEYNRERWMAASDVLTDGIAEAKYAERLILGISKASRLFADSLRAVYDDKLLDDKGNAVKSSFIRNRLAKQRNGVEYSIDNEDSKQGSGLGSALLDSIVSAQLDIADAFVENSDHTEQEILPEITELRNEIENNAQRLQAIGEAVISELKQSEIEVKNIWDVFDAMVTGDLMEYTTHGSSHGGSSHGGSLHSSSMNTGGSGSIHGFLTPRDENEALIVSSASSPLMKSSFHQLGRVEDGWLVEMYYKSAVAFQRSVFGAAEMEFCNLFQEISTLEELRFRKLHQFMLAFAPRQRRLFNKLPEQLKNVLENLVGLRIDEDSLQKVLDESVKDRSKDHLKGSTAHKSSILNRSKINARVENVENDIEDMEKTYGSPFASPMILLSKMVELKATGLKSLVNTAWKPSLCVVTSDGNMLVFGTPDKANTPPEAFKSLYPRMNFDDPDTWVTGRKVDMVKSLTPMVCIRLTKSTLALSQLRKSQIEITEEVDTVAGSRFMNAVKSRAQQTKCTLRLPSNTDASDW
eukprot:CAMPEP_0172362406 /NCGR_PEP_ID=MMETSP1060-20121228/6015_1 /TAXON_ID=37318 /ORGANISM="Pseudo-nitzschia pungens, Strain cf. cingulata" /LENGTH=994 /DNA_ID=CAMNT_0013084903 /DNA_START=192 /DNA_END=3173 /DNA_ORIENTATION=+